MSETQRIFDAASIDDEGSQLGSSRAPNNTYLNLAVFRSAQRHLKDTIIRVLQGLRSVARKMDELNSASLNYPPGAYPSHPLRGFLAEMSGIWFGKSRNDPPLA